METISRLLFRNQKNQREFLHMDGYGILQGLFDQFLLATTAESESFLQDCFNIFFTIALDGNKDLVRPHGRGPPGKKTRLLTDATVSRVVP